MKKIIIFFAALWINVAHAQMTLLTNVDIHVGNGIFLKDSKLLIQGEKIISLNGVDLENKDIEILDMKGQQLYPSFIAMNTTLGLVEINGVNATKDFKELGLMNPNLQTHIAYNTDSEVLKTVKSNGILITQIVPQGKRISGRSSVMFTEGWNWEDALVKANEGIHLNWPQKFLTQGWWASPKAHKNNINYQKSVDEIKSYFKKAKVYNETETDVRLKALSSVFSGKTKLYIHANQPQEMIDAVEFCKKIKVDLVLVGASGAWKIPSFLKDNNIELVIGPLHAIPISDDTSIHQPYQLPKILENNKIIFAISMKDAWQQRNLPFQAGTAVAYGLPYEKAIQALTLNPAKILGIDHDFGTIEVGKSATFFVSKGDVLDMKTSVITYAFINGKKIDLNNKQKELAKKWEEKYENEGRN